MIAGRSISGSSSAELINQLKRSAGKAGVISATALTYVEFQTNMLRLFEWICKKQLSTRAAFIELAAARNIFQPNQDDELQLSVIWPHHDGDREIQVIAMPDAADLFLYRFYMQGRHFLTISFVHDSEIRIEQSDQSQAAEWNNIDIANIVDNFNEVFRATRISYVSRKRKNEKVVEIQKNDITCFNKEEFDEFMQAYRDYNLTCRINNVILNNSAKRANNYTFKLIWPDSMKQCRNLKITFSRSDLFNENYSWFVNEKTLLNEFDEYKQRDISTGQYYYSLKVHEIPDSEEARKEKDIELLSLWLTVDGLFGELRDLKKTAHFSGNDLLNIFVYLNQLLQIKNTFICDESKLVNEDDSIRVPLRLISALATGKTWYESRLPGVTLFECNKFQTASNGTITQCRKVREKALTELQKYPLHKWYSVLDAKDRQILLDLYKKSLHRFTPVLRRSVRLAAKGSDDEPKNMFGSATVQDLTIKIYNDAKSKKVITSQLACLVKLLCDGINLHEDDKPLSNTLPDYWLKSRVKVLLWGSYFWVMRIDQQACPEQMETHGYRL